MAVINLTVGEDKYSKKATTEDVLIVLETMDCLQEASGMYESTNAVLDMLAHLFVKQGLTKDDLMKLPSEEFANVTDQVDDIIEIINGSDGDDKDTKK